MENVTIFFQRTYGYGNGNNYVKDNGNGYGEGYGFGYGNNYGGGSCFGLGGIYGSGSEAGIGDGSGGGRGDGDGSISGYGYAHGRGLKSVNGYSLYEIDGIQTGIYKARGNVAKGFILEHFSPVDCYIVNYGDTYAHGKTLREAEDALSDKIMESMDEDEAIEKFVEHFKPNTLYKNREFFEWHHYLTGSCRIGRENFCANHGVDMDGESTPEYFIELTKDAYGSETIRKLEKHYQKRGGRK